MPYKFNITKVHKSKINAGDIISCPWDGVHRTVGTSDIKTGGLFGISIFGDSYKAGHDLVDRVDIIRYGFRNYSEDLKSKS